MAEWQAGKSKGGNVEKENAMCKAGFPVENKKRAAFKLLWAKFKLL
jgi:hypothetical protein